MSFLMNKLPCLIRGKSRQHGQSYVSVFSRQLSSPTLIMLTDHQQTNVEFKNSENRIDLEKYPELLPKKYSIPTIIVPSSQVHTIISRSSSKPYLASTMPELDGIHPRVKIVRSLDDDGIDYANWKRDGDSLDNENDRSKKLVLIHPDAFLQNNDEEGSDFLNQFTTGPNITITLEYSSLPFQKILSAVLPLSAHPPPTGFEQVGHILHLNLKANHKPYGKLIGQILLDRFSPRISCVIDKVGEVSGPYRTYPLEILAGGTDESQKRNFSKSKNGRLNTKYNPLWVEIQEAGVNLQFDLRNVYWCSRLSGERAYFLKNELKLHTRKQNHYITDSQLDESAMLTPRSKRTSKKQIKRSNHNDKNHIIIADAFCGAGALCVQAYKQLTSDVNEGTKKNDTKSSSLPAVTIWANDLNPEAVKYCKDNARRNGIKNIKRDKKVEFDSNGGFWAECGDAFDFISELGMITSSSSKDNDTTLPHHLIMNFPLDSPSFLGALRWWPSLRMDIETKVHLYTFARADDGYEELSKKFNSKLENLPLNSNDASPRSAIDVAIDTVADSLVPEGGAAAKTKFRREYLNKLGCNVKAREVRDVAPGKMVIYVQFTVTVSLLKTMQGDFIDV